MKPADRFPVEIVVEPWFADHRFQGRAVFPAVETMLLVADQARKRRPGLQVQTMEQVLFAKFLEIPPDRQTIAAEITLAEEQDETVVATLSSRIALKSCSRLQTHGSLRFPRAPGTAGAVVDMCDLGEPTGSVDADRVYQELVPFGPQYRSLQGELSLFAGGARGVVRAPQRRPADERAYTLLGSPFPLDGAFHAACVCGQQQTPFIPFPVGFARRVIARPTEPGRDYLVQVAVRQVDSEELRCSLWISDQDGGLCETVSDLRMRDVSGGRLRPPAWISRLNRGLAPRRAAAPSRPGSASDT